MTDKNIAICIENACKTLGNQQILRNITVDFEKGKAYGIIGRNGSGKSMLFQAICGFLALDQGRVTVNGKVVGKDVDFPRDVGFIINTPGFIESFSGFRNLEMLSSLRGRIGKEARRSRSKQSKSCAEVFHRNAAKISFGAGIDGGSCNFDS